MKDLLVYTKKIQGIYFFRMEVAKILWVKTSPDISRIGVARPWRRVCHRATAGDWIRGVLEQYVAGSDTRGRQASGSESLQLGEKDSHIRGRSHAGAWWNMRARRVVAQIGQFGIWIELTRLNIYSVMEIEAESLSHRCFLSISSCGGGFPAPIRLSGWQDMFGQQPIEDWESLLRGVVILLYGKSASLSSYST